MSDFLSKLTDWQSLLAGEFNRGYLSGVAITVLILLCLLLVRTLLLSGFRWHNSPGVALSQDSGELFVSRTAIRSALQVLQDEFRSISIEKVRLYEKRGAFRLCVWFEFHTSGGNLPEYSARFKARISEILSQNLGIDGIQDIRFQVSNVKGNVAPPEEGTRQESESVDALIPPHTGF